MAHTVQKQQEQPVRALIYCRVSDKKQKTDGHGLESQEHRCRQYAEQRGLEVEMAFTDDFTGRGDFMNRPAMRALLAFLDAQNDRRYVVIFDDLKRFARDTEFHIKLRREFDMRGVGLECLNYKFENTPEGRFAETMFAAHGQLEREQNSRQVTQKMTARMEKGYWVFPTAVGYRYAEDKAHGKILVRDEPVASIVAEALEGFANGRFKSQVEVKHFLESKPDFPKSGKNGYVHPTRVRDMLRRAIYAGYVEKREWGVGLHKGQHEPLISFATYERIQANLDGIVYAPARKDINEDFPLRGFVLCDDCGEPMTSCWSKGRNKHYPYYLCDTPDCASKRKSIPRAKIEDGAEAILRSMQPAKQLMAMAKAMFKDIWDMRLAEAEESQAKLKTQVREIEKKVNSLLDRLVDTTRPSVIQAYEDKIEKLERDKIRLSEQAENIVPPKGRF